MTDDEDEYLSQDEVMALIRNLEMRYGAEIKQMLDDIEHDIKRYGHLTQETKKARKNLKDKILRERELNNGKRTH